VIDLWVKCAAVRSRSARRVSNRRRQRVLETGHVLAVKPLPTWWIHYYRNGRRHEERTRQLEQSPECLLKQREGAARIYEWDDLRRTARARAVGTPPATPGAVGLSKPRRRATRIHRRAFVSAILKAARDRLDGCFPAAAAFTYAAATGIFEVAFAWTAPAGLCPASDGLLDPDHPKEFIRLEHMGGTLREFSLAPVEIRKITPQADGSQQARRDPAGGHGAQRASRRPSRPGRHSYQVKLHQVSVAARNGALRTFTTTNFRSIWTSASDLRQRMVTPTRAT